MWYNIACELAMCVPLLAPAEAAATADESMESLRPAVERGFRNLDPIAADQAESLAPLRDREDFRALMSELGIARSSEPAGP